MSWTSYKPETTEMSLFSPVTDTKLLQSKSHSDNERTLPPIFLVATLLLCLFVQILPREHLVLCLFKAFAFPLWMLTLLKLRGSKLFTMNVLFQLYIVSGILPHQIQNSSVMAELLCWLMRVSTSTIAAWFLFMPPILQNCQNPFVIANCIQIYQLCKEYSYRCKNRTSAIASNFHVGGDLGMSGRKGKDSAWHTCVYLYVATSILGAWLTLIKTSSATWGGLEFSAGVQLRKAHISPSPSVILPTTCRWLRYSSVVSNGTWHFCLHTQIDPCA